MYEIKEFNCFKHIEEGKVNSCIEKCDFCKQTYKMFGQMDLNDNKNMQYAFLNLLNEHSKFMMHPILWKKYYLEKYKVKIQP